MWEPRPLTPLWAFTACYRDSFTYFLLYLGWAVIVACHQQTYSKQRCQDCYYMPDIADFTRVDTFFEKQTSEQVAVLVS
jgi:hypothetical protein